MAYRYGGRPHTYIANTVPLNEQQKILLDQLIFSVGEPKIKEWEATLAGAKV